jgi:hypothetical protein
MHRKIFSLIGISLLIFFTSFLIHCGKKSPTEPTPPETPIDDPSFAQDIQAIFNISCALSNCHSAASASAGLVLTTGQAYGNIVNVASTQDPTKNLITPSDAQNSYIVIKLEGRQTTGVRMPFGGNLSSVRIQNIKNWINQGANNN